MLGIEGFALAVFVLVVICASVWGFLHRDIRCTECGERMVLNKNKTWICESCDHRIHKKGI